MTSNFHSQISATTAVLFSSVNREVLKIRSTIAHKTLVEIVVRLTVCLALMTGINVTRAQVYPVRSNVILTPPYSPYFSDYTAAGSQRIMIQLTPNDITAGDHLIKLRLTLEGVGITIRTKQNFVPKPLTLYGGGSPTTFYGEDISEYFHPNNLDFAGYSRSEFTKTGKLPEGVYRFSVEVLSYNRDVPLSNRGSAMAWIILNDPPLLNVPRKDTKIKIIDPTNILFTWTPRHTGSPNSAFSTEYIFRMVEIWPDNRNANDAFLSQPALLEETTSQTQFIYGLEHTSLIPGRKYAWSVQARDIEGKDLFKNHGKSEVFVFQFGDALNPPENITQNKSNNATVIDLSWDPPLSGAMPQTYRVRYRQKGSGNIQPWYEGLADQRWIALTELQTDTEYELQMRSEGNSQVSEYSMLQFMKTGSQGTLPYECGKQDVVSIDTAAAPLLKLAVGETITAAGFKILVIEVEAKNGTFTGQGWMAVPMFNGASVKVQFTNIRVNEKFQLTAGEFVTTYSKGSKIERLMDQAHKIGEEKTEKPPAQEILSDSISSMPITLLVVIDTLYAIGDKIVIVDESGGESTYKRTVDKEGKFQAVTIVDSSGSQYIVNEDGSVGRSVAESQTVATSVRNPGAPLAIDTTNMDNFEKLVVEALQDVQKENKTGINEGHEKRKQLKKEYYKAIDGYTGGGLYHLFAGKNDEFIREGISMTDKRSPDPFAIIEMSEEDRNKIDPNRKSMLEKWLEIFESDKKSLKAFAKDTLIQNALSSSARIKSITKTLKANLNAGLDLPNRQQVIVELRAIIDDKLKVL